MKAKPHPTQQEVNDAFEYKRGVLYHKKSPSNRIKIGDIAGCLKPNGRDYVHLENELYLRARLVWIMFFGDIPEDREIDHIDGNRSNDRIQNLRLATRSQNNINVLLRRHNTSGYRGVNWNKGKHKWEARINVNKKVVRLGYFDSFTRACIARRVKELELGWDKWQNRHGKRKPNSWKLRIV